jgi:hypothetical protein
MINWLRTHKFEAHLTAFILMVLASIGMYVAANTGATGLIWVAVGVFIVANLGALFVR